MQAGSGQVTTIVSIQSTFYNIKKITTLNPTVTTDGVIQSILPHLIPYRLPTSMQVGGNDAGQEDG